MHNTGYLILQSLLFDRQTGLLRRSFCLIEVTVKISLTVTSKAHLTEYRKNSKNWDTLNYHRDCPTNGIVAFYSAILRSKDSDRITNRVDTDQTAP